MTDNAFDPGRLAVAYRRLVLWFGVQLVFTLGGALALMIVGRSAIAFPIALVRLVGILVTIVALALYAYRTSGALGSSLGALWAVAMLIPLVNVITLLILSSKATSACRKAGIPVGLLGPILPAKPDGDVG